MFFKNNLEVKTAWPWLLLVVIMLFCSMHVEAAGVLSGTSIVNRATINYEVSGVPQSPVESSPSGNNTPGNGNGSDTSFVVDNKVDLLVSETDGQYSIVSPGQIGAITTFTLTNTGNTTQDYSLAATASAVDPFGGTVNFSLALIATFVDSNNNGTYEAGVDLALFVDELAPDESITVFCIITIPALQVNGDIAAISLTATTHNAGNNGLLGLLTVASVGADSIASVDVVFADGSGDTDDQVNPDGQHSDTDACQVSVAELTVTKSSTVISDPINGTSNPKAIPGAVIEFTIQVDYDAGAAAAATNITLTDSLQSEISNGVIAFLANGYDTQGTCPATLCGCLVTAPNINGGVTLALSNAADADVGDFNATAANTVTVSGIDLNPGESANVQFQVQIQ